MILNLRELNKFITPHHFKMETFEMALKHVKQDCYVGPIDLRHAYYSVPIAEEDQKYLRFIWKEFYIQYSCLPNGLTSAPSLFTKLMKPVFATLRQYGYKNAGYIDDSLLIGDTEEECESNIKNTDTLLKWLGFVVHEKKSVFKPTKQIIYLGNIIDSSSMTVKLPEEKIKRIIEECHALIKKSKATIRLVSRVIGLLVSSFSAVEYGPLHYRNLEMNKIDALKLSAGKFDSEMNITFI